MKNFTTKHPLITFTAIAYLFSWICWLPIIDLVDANLWESPGWVIALLLLGGYGPSFSAIAVSGIIGGGAAVKALLRKFLIWRVGFKWYAVSLLYGPILLLIGTVIFAAQGNDLGYINWVAILLMPVMFLGAIIFGPLAEELGWRGFGMVELFKKHGIMVSSLVMGAIWTFWHTPLFWAAEGSGVSGMPVTFTTVGLYLLWDTGLCFVFSFVYKYTRGSVLMAVLVHLSSNGTGVARNFITPNLETADRYQIWTYGVIALWILIGVVALMRRASPKPILGRDGSQ